MRAPKSCAPLNLKQKYPPSTPCACTVCQSYCLRPGWWTVEDARQAIKAGYASRMMLEISPEGDFGVLSPAFKGNEGDYALQAYSRNGCTFLHDGLCELHGTAYLPLECAFCHHDRTGMGTQCHHDIEREWKTEAGKRLVVQWGNRTGFWQWQGLRVVEKAPPLEI